MQPLLFCAVTGVPKLLSRQNPAQGPICLFTLKTDGEEPEAIKQFKLPICAFHQVSSSSTTLSQPKFGWGELTTHSDRCPQSGPRLLPAMSVYKGGGSHQPQGCPLPYPRAHPQGAQGGDTQATLHQASSHCGPPPTCG